jgi:hypothetical protein
MNAVIDTYGSFAFGLFHTGRLPECAVSVVQNDMLPFYKERGITVKAIFDGERPRHPSLRTIPRPQQH